MARGRRLGLVALAGLSARSALSDVCEPSQFEAPRPGQSHAEWLKELHMWKNFITSGVAPSGEVYEVPELNWTRTIYTHAQVHIFERTLFNSEAFTVDSYLDDLEKRYGGLDSVLLWATYTNLGIDERNQFDLYRAVPGGLKALANVTKAFHRRGVRVLWGYNPWDNATRYENEPHWETLARLLKETGMDGYNGDTMPQMPQEFWKAGLKIGHPIAGEPEGGGFPCLREEGDSWGASGWTPNGWGYFYNGSSPMWNTNTYTFAPGVDKMRWLDDRHLTHVCDRWSKSRAEAVQLAFFNADGYVAWENIWGIFNQVTDRDGELIRRAATILRWAGKRGLVTGADRWVPHAPEVAGAEGVFASRFQVKGETLWLIINRRRSDAAAVPLRLPKDLLDGHAFLDLARGKELKVDAEGAVHIDIETLSISAVLATKKPQDAAPLMAKMRELSARPLASFSPEWHMQAQRMVPMATTPLLKEAPAGMVLLPKANFRFRVSSTEIEGGCNPYDDPNEMCCADPCRTTGGTSCQCAVLGLEDFGVGVQFPWEQKPNRNHDKMLELGPLYIDRDLVTNANYLAYLNASGYRPKDTFNWLRHWSGGRPKPGDARKPVVNVGLEEARAFCQFYGKRLPHSYEWQYAAQGLDGRKYPWGSTWDSSAVPPSGLEPHEVGQHPRGDSPFGVRDLVGNVWQYTDAFEDDHTAAALLRGSSSYHPVVTSAFPSSPQFANWYFPPAFELNRQSKYLLMSASYERAGTLGFRCVADAAGGMSGPFHSGNAVVSAEVHL